jgi:hypothetical protein
MFKILFYVLGVLTFLWILSTQFQLKNPHQPGLIDPTHPVQLPHVSVSKR